MGNQPHDGIFRRIFGDLEHARSLLQSFLPTSLAQAVNFSTLETRSTRFISKRLKKNESDLLFSAQFKNSNQKLFTYFLIEHQSSPDKWMPLRLLLYVGEIYDWCRRQNPKAEKLPFIFPFVFYHGQRKWNVPDNFRELVDIPEYLQDTIQAFVPDFSYRLEDLSPYSDEALRQLQLTACSKAVLSVLKHIFDKDLADKLPEILGDLTPWFATIKGFEEFTVVLRYIIDTSESVELSDLEEWRKRLSSDATGVIMTLADKLRAEGRAESIINILIARGLDVSDEIRRNILSCRDASVLDRWLRRALTVNASSDVLLES